MTKKEKKTLKQQFMRWANNTISGKPVSRSNDELPVESWIRIPYKINYKGKDIDIPCIYKPARKPQALVAFCGGMKASTASYEEIIEGLNKRGFSVLNINLPFPEKFDEVKEDFYAAYKEIVRHFYAAPDSPAYEIARKNNFPVFALTHSTGGLLYTDLKEETDQEFHKFTEKHVIGDIHLAPFFTASRAAPPENFKKAITIEKNTSLARKLFLHHAKRHPDSIYGDHLIELTFAVVARMSGVDKITDRKLMPKYKHILKLMEHGENLFKTLKGSVSLRRSPTTFILSDEDPHSCSIFSKRFAHKLGATVTHSKGYHNPLDGDKELLEKLADAMLVAYEEHSDVSLPPISPCDKCNINTESDAVKKPSLLSRLFSFGNKPANTEESSKDITPQIPKENLTPIKVGTAANSNDPQFRRA